MKGNWYWREAFSLPWLSKEKVDLSGYCFWGNEFSWTGSTAVDFTGHPFLGRISRSTGSECIPFVVRLQMDFSNDGLLADHHWYFELVLFVWPKYLEDIFVLISGPNAKQNAYTWNIPHFNGYLLGYHWTSNIYTAQNWKNKLTGAKQQTTLPSTPWLVGAFISSTTKNSCHLLQVAPTCWPPRRACQRILPLPRRSLSLRRQRPGLTYQSPKVGPNHAASTNPRWDQDECEKRIKQNSLTSTWFNLMEVFVHKNFIPIWICIQLWRRITHGYYKSSCFPSCCHLRSPDY